MKSRLRPILFFIFVWSCVFALFASPGFAVVNISGDDREMLRTALNEELSYVNGALAFIEENKEAVWAEGDHDFFDLWHKGIKEEKAGKYKNAIAFYEKALDVGLYEMSTYEARLPLGRVYLLMGKCEKAISTLNEFIIQAEESLAGDAEWGFTEEGEQNMRKRVALAKRLITLCR